MRRLYFVRVVALASVGLSACTVHQTDVPPVTGPSEYAQSVSLTATPDSITQDGASQSTVVLTARDATGQPLRNLQVRVGIAIEGSTTEFGTLSSRTLFTGPDGTARTIYTAPTASTFVAGGPSKIVSIVATPVGSNLAAVAPRWVSIAVTPPPAMPAALGAPTASLTYSPGSPRVGELVTFNGSDSQPTAGYKITGYFWDFGDGRNHEEHGNDASHAYGSAGSYTMVFGVVDDMGRIGSTIKTIVVAP
jgi:PKD repeat protein